MGLNISGDNDDDTDDTTTTTATTATTTHLKRGTSFSKTTRLEIRWSRNRGTIRCKLPKQDRNGDRNSSVLWAGKSGDRIPVEARFSALVQTDPGVHPASFTMDTWCVSSGVKRPGRGVNHPL